MSRGRKPILCMSAFANPAPDPVEHELAEQCAGGGVLFVDQATFEKQPDLEGKLTDYFRFRHAHRALFADPGKESYAEIALAYSIPTLMYHDYQHSAAAAPLKALAGIARALEEGHLPYDVVIFNHPEIHADRVTPDQLKRYRLVVLPALECLADAQIQRLDDLLSVHFVNYDVDYKSGQAAPTSPTPLTVTLPAGSAAEEVAWLVPSQAPHPFPCRATAGKSR